jgi:isopenicillin-N N-acyltransferase-like protein
MTADAVDVPATRQGGKGRWHLRKALITSSVNPLLTMNRRCFLSALVLLPAVAWADQKTTPSEIFTAAVENLASIYEPGVKTEPRTFSTTLRVVRAPMKEVAGRSAKIAYQAPDRFLLSADVGDQSYRVGRAGNEVWFHIPGKKWGVIGKPDVPKFARTPTSVDATPVPPFTLPEKNKLVLLPTLCTFEELPPETILGTACRVIVARPTDATREAFRLPALQIELAIPSAAGLKQCLPQRIAVRDGQKLDVAVELVDTKLDSPWPVEKWNLVAGSEDKIETTSVAPFIRAGRSLAGSLTAKIPSLPPPTGVRELIATEGKGRFEMHDGLRVVFASGTPEEMGHQQGVLLRKPIRDVVDKILYGVGVGSSLAKGRWFFGEIEEAQGRLQKFMDPRYLAEMDAIADATGLAREEVRLANYFPELFHCSGFALLGSATEGGRIYHGRILDYLKGVGLEQNATLVVYKPDRGNAWVNVGYCGFIGSVTAMNEKHISIGEMGGRGEGAWDGKPMAQLVREVMEKASTLDEAIDIMRRGPRTCEYYYVIADAKAKRAVGIKATPTIFEVVEAGGEYPQLPEAVKDCVLLSAGDRYTELVRRAKSGLGKFTADSARDLMTRPVCMGSNIHSVLFAPDTLDFWVANADSQNVASHTHYRKFNLAELLKSEPAPRRETANR